MKTIYAGKLNSLPLGRRSEHLAARVLFDVSEWEEIYGEGRPQLLYQRPDMDRPYIRLLNEVEGGVVWEITNWDTELAGFGKCELRYYVGETLVKSKTWRTHVELALDTPTEEAPEDPEQGWVDRVLEAGAQAEMSAEEAKRSVAEMRDLVGRVTDELVEAVKTAAQTAVDAQVAAEEARDASQTAEASARASSVRASELTRAAQQSAASAASSARDAGQSAGVAFDKAHDATEALRTVDERVLSVFGALDNAEPRFSAIEQELADLNDVVNPFAITSFTHDAGTRELGDTSLTRLTLSWKTNRLLAALTLDGMSLPPDSEGYGFNSNGLNPPPVVEKTTTYKLVATDERGSTVEKTTTVYFYNGIYYGAAAAPAAIDSAFVLGLASKVLTGQKNRTVKISGGDGLYAWYAYPKWLGKSLFNIGGFDYEWGLETISFTNALGYTEDYYVYRSGQYAPASLSVTVKDGG